MSTVGEDYEYHTMGGYHDARGGILWVLWRVFGTVGGKSSPLSLQWTLRAPYGASYMYGTHHLNNYHHNSKSTGIMWGFVWDPFKRCFWAASSLSSLQETSRVLCGTHLYKCFGQLPHCHHYSIPCRYRVELHMRPVWTRVWGTFHTIVTRSDPSGIMRLHMGLI